MRAIREDHALRCGYSACVLVSRPALRIERTTAMAYRMSIGTIVLAIACGMSPAMAQVLDPGKYPGLRGQWRRVVVPGIAGQQGHDQTKPPGRGQEAPLTPEYQ